MAKTRRKYAHLDVKEEGLVWISERALLARINRKLAKAGQAVRTCRESSGAFSTLGRHYVVDVDRNMVEAYNVDLMELAENISVVSGQEYLAYP